MSPRWDEWTLSELDEALEVDAENAALWRAKVGVLLRLSRWGEAQACLSRLSELADADEPYWHRPGPSLHRLARWPPTASATRCCESEVMRARGLVLTYMGRYAEAIACYSRALELAPHNELARRGLEVATAQMASHEDAVDCSDEGAQPPRDEAVLCW
jgi:tetratricopeptide (TPR) repeat protein